MDYFFILNFSFKIHHIKHYPLKMEIEMNHRNLNISINDRNLETESTSLDEFEIIDYVLVFNESTSSKSKSKLERYRQIYLENLISYGLKLKTV